jgi:hypothetical protein
MADANEMRRAREGETSCEREGCPIVPYLESRFCKVHGGALEMMRINKSKMKNYTLTKCLYRNSITNKSKNANGHSLRDEIGILRFILEEMLEKIQDSADVELKQLAIGNLVLKIEKLVSASIKSEVQLGELLSADVLMAVQQQIIDIISSHIKDTDVLDTIAIAISKIDIEQGITEELDFSIV